LIIRLQKLNNNSSSKFKKDIDLLQLNGIVGWKFIYDLLVSNSEVLKKLKEIDPKKLEKTTEILRLKYFFFYV
jgi:hypothetical protein